MASHGGAGRGGGGGGGGGSGSRGQGGAGVLSAVLDAVQSVDPALATVALAGVAAGVLLSRGAAALLSPVPPPASSSAPTSSSSSTPSGRAAGEDFSQQAGEGALASSDGASRRSSGSSTESTLMDEETDVRDALALLTGYQDALLQHQQQIMEQDSSASGALAAEVQSKGTQPSQQQLAAGVGRKRHSRRRRRKAVFGPGVQHPACKDRDCIYLDYNATTPIFPEVSLALLPYTSLCFGNVSSVHFFSASCKAALIKARGQVARLVGAQPDEIIFESCGSETDNHAIHIAIANFHRTRPEAREQGVLPHVVISAIEHPAISACLHKLQERGEVEVSRVPVDGRGIVAVDDVVSALQENTALISIMHANNEVGSLQPIEEITAAARRWSGERRAKRDQQHLRTAPSCLLVHTDAAQSIGKVRISTHNLGVDMLSIVGHKFGAPKGVGALFVRSELEAVPFIVGGSQEHRLRAGTENVMLVVAMGRAADIVVEELDATAQHMARMRERLLEGLLRHIPHDRVRVNGPALPSEAHLRLPNTLSVSFRGVRASRLLNVLADSVAVSAGSACGSKSNSKQDSMSGVLTAMRVPEEFGLGTLRLSVGRHTTAQEVDLAAERIAAAVNMT